MKSDISFGLQIGWYASPDDVYLPVPADDTAYDRLLAEIAGLPDGAALPCRGRDRVGSDSFKPWEYGVAIKYSINPNTANKFGDSWESKERELAGDKPESNPEPEPSVPALFFMWRSGRTERFAADVVNFSELVHFVDIRKRASMQLGGLEFTAESVLSQPLSSSSPSSSAHPHLPGHVLILAHGWSPDVGPNYVLIRTLQIVAEQVFFSSQ